VLVGNFAQPRAGKRTRHGRSCPCSTSSMTIGRNRT
jgi:hypothetical protein